MMHEKPLNLFSNFQSTVFKAVKAFLSRKKNAESDKSMTTSLRIPYEIKVFYDCLAEAEMTSINTAIVSTLGKVKDQTVDEYQKRYTKINDTFDYQISSLLKIIDLQKIDYNDLCSILGWASGADVKRSDITDKEKLVNLIDKKAQLKLCKIFGYNYDWLQDNSRSVHYVWNNFEDRWYKNVEPFCRALVKNFYLDETAQSFCLSFLCCDKNIVNNIIAGNSPNVSESITPIAVVDRCINGVVTRTYHQFESNDINYEKCRQHFIVLAKMIAMLVKHRIIDHPKGYLITPQQHDRILDGSMHVAELFDSSGLSNYFYIDDLEDVETHSLAEKSSHRTTSPEIYHVLDTSIISDMVMHAKKQDIKMIKLTDEFASIFNMSQKALVKYLKLFEFGEDGQVKSLSLVFPDDAGYYTDLHALEEMQDRIRNVKMLDTAFG